MSRKLQRLVAKSLFAHGKTWYFIINLQKSNLSTLSDPVLMFGPDNDVFGEHKGDKKQA